jgi:hypothetical protein
MFLQPHGERADGDACGEVLLEVFPVSPKVTLRLFGVKKLNCGFQPFEDESATGLSLP